MRNALPMPVLLFITAAAHGQTAIDSNIPKTCSTGNNPLYCYGIQANGGGTIWLDWYPNGYNNNPNATHGFVSYATPELSATGYVTAATLVDSQGQAINVSQIQPGSGTLTLELDFHNGQTGTFVAQLEWFTGMCGGGRYTYPCVRTQVVGTVTTITP